MKKYLFLSSLTILSVFIFNPIIGEAQGRGSTHKWNGKLTYVHTTNYSSNNSKGQSIWTMEVVVENGIATAMLHRQ